MWGFVQAGAAIALIAFTMGSTVQPTARTAPHLRYFVQVSDVDDDQPIFFDGGPVVLMRDHSHRTGGSNWMRFGVDGCGNLERVERGRAQPHASAFDEDDLDDDPAAQGRLMVGQWLSTHPEIAVINDGVEKDCSTPFDVDYEDPAFTA